SEPGTGRAPHKLSGCGDRRKPAVLASSFQGVAAGLALESGIGPGTGWVLPIDSRVEVRCRRRHAPRPLPGASPPGAVGYVASRSEKGRNSEPRPVGGHITGLAT